MTSPAIALYRQLLRQTRTLHGKGTQEYYRHHVRQHFNSHRDESDPQRVAVMLQRAQQDAQWILKKAVLVSALGRPAAARRVTAAAHRHPQHPVPNTSSSSSSAAMVPAAPGVRARPVAAAAATATASAPPPTTAVEPGPPHAGATTPQQRQEHGGRPTPLAGGGAASNPPGGGASRRAPAPLAASPLSRMLLGFVSTLLWMLCSSLLIMLNKSLYRRGFHYPSTVTGMGQLFSAAAGLGLSACGLQHVRPAPSARDFLLRLSPTILATAATMYFGNAAYLYLSVSFIQILKAFTPALTLLLCVAAGLERPSWPLAGSVLLIAGGTAAAVLVESGAPSFQPLGLAAFTASSFTEALRVVGAEALQSGGSKLNTAETLVYVAGPAALLLLALGAVAEGPAIMAGGGLAMAAADPLAFGAAFAMSALVNMTCFFAIQTTSSLTFKVAGCVKNVAVVGYSLAAHGERVTGAQMASYGISVAGFALYSRLKMAAASGAAAAAAGKGGGAQARKRQ